METLFAHAETQVSRHWERPERQPNWRSTSIESARGVLDTVRRPVFLTDEELHMLIANEAGTQLIERGDVIRIKGGRLAPVCIDARKRLCNATGHALLQGTETSQTGVLVKRGWGERPLALVVNVLRGAHYPTTTNRGRLLQVSIIDVDAPTVVCRNLLKLLFSLTRREQDLACLLVQGYSVKEVSKELGITTETVRCHLKQVFSKTGTSRQPDLVRTLLLCAA